MCTRSSLILMKVSAPASGSMAAWLLKAAIFDPLVLLRIRKPDHRQD